MLITLKHKLACLERVAAKEAAEPKSKLRPATVLRAPTGRGGKSFDGDVIASALTQDLDALEQLENVADKIELKKQLVPKWREVVDKYLYSGAHHPFEPLVRAVIWLIDVEQIDVAIEYADLAIAQQQQMPEGFKRDLPTYVAEELHNWTERQFKEGHSAEPYFSQVIERIESRAWLVKQQVVLSKIYRLAGMIAESAGELEKAENAYLKCIDVNPVGHGVKGKLAAVQAKMGN